MTWWLSKAAAEQTYSPILTHAGTGKIADQQIWGWLWCNQGQGNLFSLTPGIVEAAWTGRRVFVAPRHRWRRSEQPAARMGLQWREVRIQSWVLISGTNPLPDPGLPSSVPECLIFTLHLLTHLAQFHWSQGLFWHRRLAYILVPPFSTLKEV